MPQHFAFYRCPDGHGNMYEVNIPSICHKCRKEVDTRRAHMKRAHFDSYTRGLLSAPMGKDAASKYNCARDVDNDLRSIQAEYPHFPGIA